MSATDVTAARLRRPGPDGARVLLIAGRSWLDSTSSSDEQRVPVRMLDRLWLSTRRGVELDVVCGLERVLRLLESFVDAWDIAAYDAVVLLPDPTRSPLPHRLQRVLDRLAAVTRVVGVTDTAIRAGAPEVPSTTAAQGWHEIRLPPAVHRPASLIAETVAGALLGVLAPNQLARALEAPRNDSVVDHLQRIVVLASSAFAVGSAAIAVLAAGRSRTIAAVGPSLGDQACVRAAAVRPMLVLDAWHETRLARDVRPRGEIRFFAGHPLELADGSAMGTLTIFDAAPRTEEEFDPDVLRDLAVLASAELQHAGPVA